MKKIFLAIVFISAISAIEINAQQYRMDTVITFEGQTPAFAFLPNNNLLITFQLGEARIYSLNNTLVSIFWNFTDSVYSGGESGLLGVCLDPNYAVNKYVYFYYTKMTPRSIRVVRMTDNNNVGTNPVILFEEPMGMFNTHVGGTLHFGPDGKLYVSIGDHNQGSHGQMLNTHRGKMLRINADGSIPLDNPFYDDGNPDTGNDDRIWAYGIRNTFGFAFSPFNDSLYGLDNGGGPRDEINQIRKGGNYGWSICMGYCYPRDPAFIYPMDTIPGNGLTNYAPTGLLFYTGTVMPELTGKMLMVGIGASQQPVLFRGLAKCELGNPPFYDTVTSKTVIHDMYATGLAQGNDGYIYILGIRKVRKLVYSSIGIHNQNIPVNFSLEQNYPNPFNPVTSIKYEIPKSGFVSLKIFNILGMEVTTIVNETKQQGSYEVSWDASSYPSAVYFYELSSGNFKERRKMILIK